jgi:hypothetical protein
LPTYWRPGDQGLRRLAREVDGGLAAAAQLLSVSVAGAARAAAFQLGDVAGLAHAPCWLPASGLQVRNSYHTGESAGNGFCLASPCALCR